MNKILPLSLAFLFLAASGTSFSQIKLFTGGKTSIGTTTAHGTYKHRLDGTLVLTSGSNDDFIYNSNRRFQLGGATDGAKFSIYEVGNTALGLKISHSFDWGYAQLNEVNRTNTKAIAVWHNANERFLVYGGGFVYSYGYYNFSDSTLKENIQPLNNALVRLLQLKGFAYRFKKEPISANASADTYINPGQNKTEIGLLAQQVEQIFPEVVSTTDKGIKAIAYEHLIPVLIEAIKEQQAKINLLESRINSCYAIKN